MPSPAPVLDRVRPLWHAVVATVVPEAARLSAGEWAEVDAIAARTLASRSPRVQRQVALLLRLLDWLPVFRYGRRLSALDAERRARFLTLLQAAAPLLLRRGFWGIRTLALMGYYGRPAAAAAIGYHAEPRGWEARP